MEDWSLWFQRLYRAIPKIQTFSVDIDPGSVAAGDTLDFDVTVEGLTEADNVSVVMPVTLDSGLVIGGCLVSADETLTVRFGNVTAGAIDPGSMTYEVTAVRQ